MQTEVTRSLVYFNTVYIFLGESFYINRWASAMMVAKFSWVGVVLVTNLADHGKIASKIFHVWQLKHLCKAMPVADTIWCGGGTQAPTHAKAHHFCSIYLNGIRFRIQIKNLLNISFRRQRIRCKSTFPCKL